MLIMVVSLKQISKSEAINLLKNFVLEDRGIDKKIIALIFSLFKTVLFSIYKMGWYHGPLYVISIVTVIRNPEILKSVSDHLKTKKMCNHVVKKLPF